MYANSTDTRSKSRADVIKSISGHYLTCHATDSIGSRHGNCRIGSHEYATPNPNSGDCIRHRRACPSYLNPGTGAHIDALANTHLVAYPHRHSRYHCRSDPFARPCPDTYANPQTTADTNAQAAADCYSDARTDSHANSRTDTCSNSGSHGDSGPHGGSDSRTCFANHR